MYVTVSSYGYSILYPAALFDGPPAPERGGITLTSRNGARLDIFGGHNPDGLSVEAVARQVAGSEGVEQVTYRHLGNRWLVLSGYLAGGPAQPPGSIFYERIALSADGRILAGFRLVYPASARAVFDPVIATIGNSLQPPARERVASAVAPPANREATSAAGLAHQNGADGNIPPMTRRGILSCATTANTFPA